MVTFVLSLLKETINSQVFFPFSFQIYCEVFFNLINGAFMNQVLPNDIDLLNPPAELEKRRHKLKRLVQSPNSFFMVCCSQLSFKKFEF